MKVSSVKYKILIITGGLLALISAAILGIRYDYKEAASPIPPPIAPNPYQADRQRGMVEAERQRAMEQEQQAMEQVRARDPYSAIDKILEEMANASIAFNAPQTMSLEDTAMIQLKLSLKADIDVLKQLIEAQGVKEGFKVKVADRMEARLSGQNFAITAITPEIQAVSRNEVTTWDWEVKPRGKGRQYLHLTLSALIGVDNTSTPRTIRTFSKVVNVEITPRQQMESFIEQNWQWLWATLLVPVAGWAWRSRTRRL